MLKQCIRRKQRRQLEGAGEPVACLAGSGEDRSRRRVARLESLGRACGYKVDWHCSFAPAIDREGVACHEQGSAPQGPVLHSPPIELYFRNLIFELGTSAFLFSSSPLFCHLSFCSQNISSTFPNRCFKVPVH